MHRDPSQGLEDHNLYPTGTSQGNGNTWLVRVQLQHWRHSTLSQACKKGSLPWKINTPPPTHPTPFLDIQRDRPCQELATSPEGPPKLLTPTSLSTTSGSSQRPADWTLASAAGPGTRAGEPEQCLGAPLSPCRHWGQIIQ